MPFTATLEANDFDEEMRLLTVWLFIAVGQLIFLMTWLLSISKFGHLPNSDLTSIPMSEEKVLFSSKVATDFKTSSKTLPTTKI